MSSGKSADHQVSAWYSIANFRYNMTGVFKAGLGKDVGSKTLEFLKTADADHTNNWG